MGLQEALALNSEGSVPLGAWLFTSPEFPLGIYKHNGSQVEMVHPAAYKLGTFIYQCRGACLSRVSAPNVL